MSEEWLFLIPVVLIVAVIIAFTLTRRNKIETKGTPATEAIPVVPEPPGNETPSNEQVIKITLPKPDNTPNIELIKAIQELKEGFNELKSNLKEVSSQVNSANPADPNIDPMEIVRPAPVVISSGGNESGIIPLAKMLLPAVAVLLFVMLSLSGYVKVSNYVADSTGLNERISQVENSTALTGAIGQINKINEEITTIKSREPSYVTTDRLAAMGTSITQLQGEITSLKNQLTTLQAQTANITKTLNK